MSDTLNLNDRIQSRRPAVVVTEDDPNSSEDWGTFGVLRGAKERAVMLNLKLKTGDDDDAFAYALLERVTFDRSIGIVLRFPGIQVTLIGRNLKQPVGSGVSLLEAIHRHRVSWISECDEVRSWTHAADVPVVTRIEIISAR